MLLSEVIIKRIKNEGPISFRDFMEMALYHPELGYYTSKKEIIGKNGDFFTSSSLSDVFGVLLAKQIEEMWHIMGEEDFTIVEYGAGTGRLCHDILDYFKSRGNLYEHLNYFIIEKSNAMQEKEKKHLTEKVKWFQFAKEIPKMHGCILSNELIDTFPVHLVIMKNDLMEIFVDYDQKFKEILMPAKSELKNYFSKLRVELPANYKTEINLDAINWIKDVSAILKKGYVLTIDYGYPSWELYSEFKNKGTLTCFNKHMINNQPYVNIGEQDITAHVNFSALCLWGFYNGLDYGGFTDQAHFLLGLGFKEYLRKMKESDNDAFNLRKEIFLNHMLIEEMGHQFKVLIQRKEVPDVLLSGLKD